MKYTPKMISDSNYDFPLFIWKHLLLHPNIPKPLHGLNPRTLLGQDWWDVERQKAYQKNNYHCWACGVAKSEAKFHHWLEAHECYEIDYEEGIAEMKMISALCHACHNYIHNGRLQELLNSNEIEINKYNEIMIHGSFLVAEIYFESSFPKELKFLERTLASLKKLKNREIGLAEWKEWRLVLNGISYEPIHKSVEDWMNFYHG